MNHDPNIRVIGCSCEGCQAWDRISAESETLVREEAALDQEHQRRILEAFDNPAQLDDVDSDNQVQIDEE